MGCGLVQGDFAQELAQEFMQSTHEGCRGCGSASLTESSLSLRTCSNLTAPCAGLPGQESHDLMDHLSTLTEIQIDSSCHIQEENGVLASLNLKSTSYGIVHLV